MFFIFFTWNRIYIFFLNVKEEESSQPLRADRPLAGLGDTPLERAAPNLSVGLRRDVLPVDCCGRGIISPIFVCG